MDAAACGGVRLVTGDIATLAESHLPPAIDVCLLDVDLEIPTYEGLLQLVPRLAPGGIALVDDCDPDSDYAGARVGYRRLVSEHSLPEEYFMTMGIVHAPSTSA